ncbi:hypothetical protein [Phocaeicola plebeius]|uniref:hypothetical protein n=1 Tax=Phocaeicola plebeius TaxID=310297 RepID=UPI001958652A|nr:hypothetical protein [Phocaeicola plebeius]MBM6842760.1 hypothetical protein [Phocaeicola plebeius]
MYILQGESKAIESLIKEQRIRIGRGLITITPASEAGIVSEEDVKKTFDSQQKVIDELSEKNKSYEKEIDELKARLAELDSHVDDAKDVPEEDTKDVEQADTKEVPAEDDKEADVQDEKKVSASKKKK